MGNAKNERELSAGVTSIAGEEIEVVGAHARWLTFQFVTTVRTWERCRRKEKSHEGLPAVGGLPKKDYNAGAARRR